MQEIVEVIVSHVRSLVELMVDRKDEVIINHQLVPESATLLVNIRVADREFGKVIGRGGSNIKSMRTIFEAIAAKNRLRLVLEVADK